jgi:hypothetical protein
MQHPNPNPHDHAAARRTAGYLRQLEQDRLWCEARTIWTGDCHTKTQRQIRRAPRWWAAILRRIPLGTAPNPGCR